MRSTSVTSIGGSADVPSMNFGSQCQNHRPSRWRRLVRRPSRSVGRGRCGLYSWIMLATSSSESNPDCMRSYMKLWIRDAPDWSMSGTMSTSTTARDVPGAISPSRSIEVKPPSEAPTNTGFGGRSQYFEHIAGKGGDAIVPVFGPVGLAVATEVERDRLPSALGHRGGGTAPGSAGLAATMQEDHHGCRGSPIRSQTIRTPPSPVVVNASGAEVTLFS